MKRYLTAESVCIGHPDKVCDRISDAILDAALEIDDQSRVAVETLATSGKIVVAGEISCKGRIDVRRVVRDTLAICGYDPDRYSISVFLHGQSRDISDGVTCSLESRMYRIPEEMGAGDQGTMYGYATSETDEMLPLPLVLAHRICWCMDRERLTGRIKGIHSDGKAQVSVEYDGDKPVRVSSVVISIQHDEEKNLRVLEDEIYADVIPEAFSSFPIDKDTDVYINPSGRFVEGGPEADTGLTGRKIMVDTYGGLAPHGGGAFSGKDCSKVDRSGAYMARSIAKHIVYAGAAERVTVAISYAIGKANPVAVNIDTHGTGRYPEEAISKAVQSVFPLKPGDIMDFLDLREPIFRDTSSYGHFTDSSFPWEAVYSNLVHGLKEKLNG